MSSKIDKHRNFEVGQTAYTYQCKACEIEEDLYYHMNEERPETYQCPTCGTRMSMCRVFGNNKIHIPYQWGDDNKIDFSKSPSGRKHFWATS